MSENEPESVDRRMVFRNVQLLKPEDRVANSQILQFISTNANIGNYMPVRAIQDMLGEEADVWNLHRPADWDFINNNYKAIVIGGAGLLARPFNHFWVACAEHCKLPIIVWGIGTCIIDGLAAQDTMCDVEAVNSVFKRALMVNVRDEVTAELYGAGNDRDEQQRIRMDDWELREEVQHAVKLIWPTVTTANLFEHTDYASYKAEFLKLFGFGIAGVDYAADVDPVVPFAVVDLAGD